MTVSTTPRRRGQTPAAIAVNGYAPARVLEVELTLPLPTVGHDGKYRRLWVLGRLQSEPIGVCILPLEDEGLTPDQLAALLWREYREPVAQRYAAAGVPEPSALTGHGLGTTPAAWPFWRDREELRAAAPFISVVICTRDRPEQLASCLRGLSQQKYPRFEVVVVDNAPCDAVRALAGGELNGKPLRYVPEPRAGLSWARNAGTAAASGEIIAFLDDDEQPDRHWLAGLARGFSRGGDVACVSGLVLPASLDTQAEELFEQLGGHSKDRGFSPAIFSRHGPQSPLYPLPPFGVGANMAFRREALARIGGFDVALGAGTPAFAGEDTLALTLILLAGYRIAYEPAALTWHHHRGDVTSLGQQLRGYGVGLTAFYAALLRRQPGVILELLRMIPAAVGYLRAGKDTRPVPQDLPVGLRLRQRWWMLTGPVAYIRSVRKQTRVAVSARHVP
jgi:glycosyltransferase involved in cell wall biosynthesis